MSDKREFFTVCFKGDVRSIKGSPFKIESPFGEVEAIGLGNEFARSDKLEEELETMRAKAEGR